MRYIRAAIYTVGGATAGWVFFMGIRIMEYNLLGGLGIASAGVVVIFVGLTLVDQWQD